MIQAALPNGPYAVNFIHSPFHEELERGNVDFFLARGVTVVEASAFMNLTPQIVRYHTLRGCGQILALPTGCAAPTSQ